MARSRLWAIIFCVFGMISVVSASADQSINDDGLPPLPDPAGDTSKQKPPPAPDETKYYIAVSGANGVVKVGPLSLKDIVGRINNGTIDKDTLISTKGMSSWVKVCDLAELKQTCADVELLNSTIKKIYGDWTKDDGDIKIKFDESGAGYYFNASDGSYIRYGISHNHYFDWHIIHKDQNVFTLMINAHNDCGNICSSVEDIIFIDDNKFQYIKTGSTYTRDEKQ